MSLLTSCDATWRSHILGALDTTTGWYRKTFTDYTIKALTSPDGINPTVYGNRSPHTFYTNAAITEFDELIDYTGRYFCINGVRNWSEGDTFIGFQVDTEYLEHHSDRPATYGTGATIYDSRYRTKQFIDTYVNDAAITNNVGTQANWLSAWLNQTGNSPFDYSLRSVMASTGKNIDGIYCISPSTVTPHISEYNHQAYGYTEDIPIQIITANKLGLDANNLQNKMAMELRRIIEQYPLGSLRSMKSGKPDTLDSKNQIYSYNYIMSYKRAVETAPSYPTLSYGSNQGSTYTIPIVTRWQRISDAATERIDASERMGNISQKGGIPDYQLILYMDVSISPSTLSWERSQTGVKTDVVAEQVFLDALFNGQTDTDQAYQNLDMGWGGPMKVTVENVNRDNDDLTVTFNVYSNTAPTDYKVWYGFDT